MASPPKHGPARHWRCGGRSIRHMKLATGTVIGGRIVVDGEPLPEGMVVTVLARQEEEAFDVPPELERELIESLAQAERGEAVPADVALRCLRGTA